MEYGESNKFRGRAVSLKYDEMVGRRYSCSRRHESERSSSDEDFSRERTSRDLALKNKDVIEIDESVKR